MLTTKVTANPTVAFQFTQPGSSYSFQRLVLAQAQPPKVEESKTPEQLEGERQQRAREELQRELERLDPNLGKDYKRQQDAIQKTQEIKETIVPGAGKGLGKLGKPTGGTGIGGTGTGATTSRTPFGILDPVLDLPLPAQIGIGVGVGVGILACSVPAVLKIRNYLQSPEFQKKFDKVVGLKMQAYLEKEPKQLAWWDQPRWQQKSLAQHLCAAVYKPPIPETMEFLHQREFEKLKTLGSKASRLDDEKFSGKEFLAYMRVRADLARPDGVGLAESSKCLNAAMSAKRSFDKISQVESQYFSRKQQEFYGFVDALLQEKLGSSEFQTKLKTKLAEILEQVPQERGKAALQTHAEAVLELSKFEYGLELLQTFKQYNFTDYVILRQVDELLQKLKNLDLTNSMVLQPEVMANYEAFEKLAPIIKMPAHLKNPDGFAWLIYFMVLEAKHQVAYQKFRELTLILEKWVEPYKQVVQLRKMYSANEYRLPKDFTAKIPGLEEFEKYKSVVPGLNIEENPASPNLQPAV